MQKPAQGKACLPTISLTDVTLLLYHFLIVFSIALNIKCKNAPALYPHLRRYPKSFDMPWLAHILPCEAPLLFRTHHIDHLTADGACLAGSEVAVISLLEVYADFVCCLHLESFKSLSSFRSSHTFHFYLPFCFPGSSAEYAASAFGRFGLAVILYLGGIKISVVFFIKLLSSHAR